MRTGKAWCTATLKPENILVHERAPREGYHLPGLVKVTDFDLGKAANAAAVGSKHVFAVAQ